MVGRLMARAAGNRLLAVTVPAGAVAGVLLAQLGESMFDVSADAFAKWAAGGVLVAAVGVLFRVNRQTSTSLTGTLQSVQDARDEDRKDWQEDRERWKADRDRWHAERNTLTEQMAAQQLRHEEAIARRREVESELRREIARLAASLEHERTLRMAYERRFGQASPSYEERDPSGEVPKV